MAKFTPSTETPWPENIGRIVTGTKSANRSVRNSRSIQSIPAQRSSVNAAPRPGQEIRSSNFCRLELHGLAAAAGGNLVRIVEDELGLHLVGLVVHLGAEQEQHGLGVDQDLHALVLDDLVGRPDF